MKHMRTGGAVAAVHALLLAAAWQAGLHVGGGGREAAPLQVALLQPTTTAARDPHPAPPAPAAPRLPPMPMLPAPAVATVTSHARATPAAPAETPPRAAELAAPVAQPAPTLAAAAPAQAPAASAPAAALAEARPDHQRCPSAPYPAALRERGIEGVVLLRVRVGADGLASDVHVTAGSGWLLMDQAALARARGCRFLPARRGSEAVESWVEFPVRFVLQG